MSGLRTNQTPLPAKASGGSGEPPLPAKGRGPFAFSCNGRRVAALRRSLSAADTPKIFASRRAASTVEIAPDLQRLGTNVYLRCRRANWLLTGSIGNEFTHPLPAVMAIFVEGPCRAAVFPDLHSPVIAVGRNCECICEPSRDHHSAEHSNQKKASSSHSWYPYIVTWLHR